MEEKVYTVEQLKERATRYHEENKYMLNKEINAFIIDLNNKLSCFSVRCDDFTKINILLDNQFSRVPVHILNERIGPEFKIIHSPSVKGGYCVVYNN